MHETRMHKIAEESAKKQQAREAKLKDVEENERSRRQYMLMKDKQRAKTIQAFRSAMHEDNEQRKEIAYLKKIDQEENRQRAKNFYVRCC